MDWLVTLSLYTFFFEPLLMNNISLDCTLQFTARYRLVDHLKSHTQEKSCACPNCGTMFGTYTKLKDHCRQSNKGKLINI